VSRDEGAVGDAERLERVERQESRDSEDDDGDRARDPPATSRDSKSNDRNRRKREVSHEHDEISPEITRHSRLAEEGAGCGGGATRESNAVT